jgi:PAS domain S-box-containing protein
MSRRRTAIALVLMLGAVLLLVVRTAPAQELMASVAEPSAEQLMAERMLASILRSAPSGIGVVENRIIVNVNDYITRLTGYSHAELLGQSARMLYPTDQDYEYVGVEKYRQIAERGTGSVQTRWQHKDGSLLDVILSSTPLNPEDLSVGVVFTVLDISDRQRSAAVLEQRTRWFIGGLGALMILQLILIAVLGRISFERKRVARALASDIAKRKLTEQELAASRQMLHDVINTIPVRVFWKDPQGKYLGCNRLFAQDAGMSDPADIIGADDYAMSWVEQAGQYRADDREVMDSEMPKLGYEERQTTPDGRRIWLRTSKIPLRTVDGRPYGLLGVYEDISPWKKIEAELRSLNESLEERISERTSELAASNRDLLRTNEELETTLATLHETQDSLIQSEKLAALGQLVAGIAHELNTPLGAIVSSNQSLMRLIGTNLVDVARVIARLPEALLDWFDERLATALATPACITESGSMQRARKALLTRLAGQTAELRQPETVKQPVQTSPTGGRGQYRQEGGPSEACIDAILDLQLDEDPLLPDMLTRYPDCDEAICALHTLLSIRNMSSITAVSAERAASVVSALLYYIRQDNSESMVTVEIARELDSLLTLYANQLKHDVLLARDYRCAGLVQGNRAKLNQVWLNLIRNALQAMEYSGTLGLGIDHIGDWIVVSVSDCGPGIPEHLRQRIFEPFFTTKPSGEGTGLGLDICGKIVDWHHGRIELESKPGQTVFKVWLPAIPGA